MGEPRLTAPLDALSRYPRGRRVQRPWWKVSVPWTLHQYVTIELIRVIILGMVLVSLLYTVLVAFQVVRSGLQLNFVWPLLAKTFAYPLYYSIPIAFLFAVTLVFGRMVSDLEVAALRTHGVSHLQLFTPVFVLAAVLCGLSTHINGWVVPEIHYEKRNLQAYILKQLESLGSGVNRTLLLPDGAGTLWVGEYEDTNLWRVDIDLQLRGRAHLLPEVQNRLPDQLPAKVKILAREGKLELNEARTAVILNLHGVDVLVPEAVQGATVANERFHQKFTISQNVVIPLSFAPKTPSVKDRTQPELLEQIRRLREDVRRMKMFDENHLAYASYHPQESGEAKAEAETSGAGKTSSARSVRALRHRIAKLQTEFYRRLGFSFSTLTFPLVGIALTLLLDRWNRLVPFVLANLVVMGVFYPLLIVGVALGKSGFLPCLAMILPNLAVLALGILLLRKVLRQ